MQFEKRSSLLDGDLCVFGISMAGISNPLTAVLDRVARLKAELGSALFLGCHPVRRKELNDIFGQIQLRSINSHEFWEVGAELKQVKEKLASLNAEDLIFVLAPSLDSAILSAKSQNGLSLKDKISSDPHWAIKILPREGGVISLFYGDSHRDLEVFCKAGTEMSIQKVLA